jgi:hypothetical protein
MVEGIEDMKEVINHQESFKKMQHLMQCII